MTTNPFDDPNGTFYALVNEEGQYSLWPCFAPVPAGWTVAHGARSRQSCLDYVEQNWTDMRPASLAGHGGSGRDRPEPSCDILD